MDILKIKSMDIIGSLEINNFMKRLIISLCLASMGCSLKDDRSKNTLVESEKLIQISLSTDGRKRDTTGAFAIELNKNLTVNYYGGSESDLAGNYIGEIEVSDWDKLSKLIDEKQIKDTVLSERSFEDNYFDLAVKFRHEKRYITGFYSHAPQNIKEICDIILSTKKKTNFEKVSKNHLFEVKVYKVKKEPDDSIYFKIPKVR